MRLGPLSACWRGAAAVVSDEELVAAAEAAVDIFIRGYDVR